ncbi:MAG: acetolactate synthase large subunit, partial [Candidatus Aureabacteria bacterium]|nr:acetolactate synthase large subunit [Candidatus Auribacterota bacterium]
MKTKKNGAQTLIDCLKKEEIEYIFGYPGGSNIPIMDALLSSGIKFILTRHEQGATHMADGYARVTGKPGVVLVTSGPGATNTITGIMTAHMDSIPMIILCGQMATSMLGKDAFQETDMFGISMPIVKHSYLIKDVNAIPRIVKEAFHITQTGRPGPVLIDIPKDISSGLCTASSTVEMDLPGYHLREKGDTELIKKAAEALHISKKPLLLIGHGCVLSNAHKEVRELAEKLHIPVVNTLLGKGAFPED